MDAIKARTRFAELREHGGPVSAAELDEIWAALDTVRPTEILGAWKGDEFDTGHDMNGKLVSRRQVPLGPSDDGGGIHGALWHEGKLWVLANRLHAILRIDPVSWTPEFQIPLSPLADRYHAIAWDDSTPGGAIYAVTGNNSKSYKEGYFGLHKYDAAGGRLLEIIDFAPGSADPHGLAMHNGKLISCDAGIHPGWPNYDSPNHGYIFEITIA